MLRYNFSQHLRLYGPGQLNRDISLSEARSYCRHLALTHYENFTVASFLLPRKMLRHFHSVYAYCRWSDDLADETTEASGAASAPRGTTHNEKTLELLRWWREELQTCYTGKPRHPVMLALRETIHEFNIPPKPFLDLLSAFEQDQHVQRYDTFAQLLDYCARSANPVGHFVLYLCRSYDEERAKLADSICTGLQLANFWQDIARDLRIGRVYLPAEDRYRYGYWDADLEARRYDPAFVALMTHEVTQARQFLEAGRPLVGMVPQEFRVEIEMFVQGGLAILDEIVRCNYNVWQKRPTVTKLKKVALLLRTAVLPSFPRSAWERTPRRSASYTYLATLRRSVTPRAETKRIYEASLKQFPRISSPALGVGTRGGLACSYGYCARLARRRAGNFYYAFRILPRAQRRAMYALYSFMRIADDIADDAGHPNDKQAKLQAWKSALDAALNGQFSHPIHAALRDVVERYSIPAAYLHTLVDGVQSDLMVRRFPTFANLYAYCYKVASVVGLACIRIWGCDDSRAEPFAEAAGIAFQLTNILRDLPEDARNGRVYLPQEDLARFGCSEQQLEQGPCDQAYRDLLRFQLQRAREYYEKAQPLMNFLRPAGRAVFYVMLRLYRGLLDAIERQGFDRISGPVRLSTWRKLALVAQALPVRLEWIRSS